MRNSTHDNHCRICTAFLVVRTDPDVSPIILRSICACHVTARCTKCGNGPVVQEVYDPLLEFDVVEPDLRCRGCSEDLIDPIVDQPNTKAPEGPLVETILYEIARDSRVFECASCEHHYKGKQARLEKTRRGWVIACPACGVTELGLYVPREKTKTNKCR